MAKERKIHFIIDHIDPLGQGVYKNEGEIYFIPKTLPGETGVAYVLKSKKNIHFCELISINQKSAIRETSVCPHFDQCPGCHFLHTDYGSELGFKAASFERMLTQIGSPEFSVISAPERTRYRNRIQLHYRKKEGKLGFIQGKRDQIVEVPECKIFRKELDEEFKRVCRSWKPIAKKPKGHVEIYLGEDNGVKVHWDKRYSEGGFTQVNREMNKLLLENLSLALNGLNVQSALDLFGGDGNLTAPLAADIEIAHIDLYPPGEKPNFYSYDLTDPASLDSFSKIASRDQFELFVVDPPRAGFRMLAQWVERFKPKYLAYVSCHPQTMVRDLKELSRPHKVIEAKMLDLFPSTYHFEAMTLIQFH